MTGELEVIEARKGINIKQSIYIALSIYVYEIIIGFILFILDSAILTMLGLYQTKYQLSITYIELITTVITYIIIIKKHVVKGKNSLKLKYKLNIKIYLFAVLILIGYNLVYGNSLGILIESIDKNSWIFKTMRDLMQNSVVAFISMLLVAPVFEEIIFRGIILEQLSIRYSKIMSVLVSAVLFGVFHFNFIQGINAFFLGIILGTIYVKTNSLVPCILVHFTNNLTSYASVYFPSVFNDDFSIIQLVLGIIILMAAIIVFINKDKEKIYEKY